MSDVVVTVSSGQSINVTIGKGLQGDPGLVQSVVAGTNVTVDNTDPANPVVSATGVLGAVDSVNGQTGAVVLDIDDVAPTQTGNSGKVLKTDGTNATWQADTGGSVDSVNGQSGTVSLDQDDIPDGTTYKQYSQTEKTKLAGIETAADVTDTANVTAAGALMDSEVTNLAAVKAFDPTDYATAAQGATADTAVQPGDLAAVATSGDYGDLSNTPDLSVYDEVEQYADLGSFPGTGNAAKFYLAQDTGIMYRWTGATYAVISAQLALGETSSTAYRGDRGKIAYDHSLLTSGNPHSVTKSDVGLGNADNTSDLNKPISTATQAALDDKQDVLSEGPFVDGDKTKLNGIEAGADVTDATNVDAAGATMNTDTSLAGNSYFLDEDTMSSDDATKVPSQQSVKAYADTKIGGSTGSTDETLLRANGTGGKTAQASDVTLDDAEIMTFPQQTSYNTGTVGGSIIKPAGIDVRWDYTQTVQPTSDGSDFDTPETSTNMVGSAFRVVWDSIIDSTTTFVGPSTQAGFFGPQAVFQLQGKVRYNKNFSAAAMTPIGFGDQLQIHNTVGADRIISGGWQFMGNRTYIADTNNVTIERGDTLEGSAAFFDNTAYTTKNGGTMDSAGTDVYHFGFASSFYVTEDVTLNGRATFLATDLNGPDTIHARPAVGVVDKNIGLWIKPHSWGVKNLGILNESTTVNLPLTVEVADASATISILYSTVELNNTSGGPVTLTSTPTIIDGYMDGQEIMVINTSANSVTLQGQDVLGSSNIAGGAITLATGQSEKYTFSETTGLWEPRSKNIRATLTSGYQPLDSDLTTIAGLTATSDNFMQAKSGAWASRTPAQVAADLTHNNLGGLTTGDPHTQYALLAGRSGGQTLYGGTDASNTLLLRSTSHATKGYISIAETPATKVFIGGTSAPADATATFGVNTAQTFSAAGTKLGSDFRASPTFNTTAGGSWTTADFTALPVATANMASVTGVAFQAGGSGAGTITTATGMLAFATSAGATVTTSISAHAQVGGFTGAVTSGVGFLVSNGQFFGSTTNATGIYIGGLPGSTSKIGIDVAAQTGASTTNIGIRIDKSTQYALQLSSTAGDAASGITFGTDTTLYRSAADTLKTDDALSVTGTLSAAGTIELGHATDTTLSRSSAGVLAVEGVVVPTISSTNTLTNKRITERVSTTTSSATPTINTDNVDMYGLTAQTANITSFTTNLSGTPTNGQRLWIYVVGTAARAITWGASFENGAVTLPTTTVTTERLDVLFVWNSVTSKWRCMASGSA